MDLVFLRDWKNKRAHFSLVKTCIGWVHLMQKSPHMQSAFEGLYSEPQHNWQSWCSLSLIDTLLSLANTDLYPHVRRIFKSPLESFPELLVCGLAQVCVSAVFCLSISSLSLSLSLSLPPSLPTLTRYSLKAQLLAPSSPSPKKNSPKVLILKMNFLLCSCLCISILTQTQTLFFLACGNLILVSFVSGW